jgi:hypothetical protein
LCSRVLRDAGGAGEPGHSAPWAAFAGPDDLAEARRPSTPGTTPLSRLPRTSSRRWTAALAGTPGCWAPCSSSGRRDVAAPGRPGAAVAPEADGAEGVSSDGMAAPGWDVTPRSALPVVMSSTIPEPVAEATFHRRPAGEAALAVDAFLDAMASLSSASSCSRAPASTPAYARCRLTGAVTTQDDQTALARARGLAALPLAGLLMGSCRRGEASDGRPRPCGRRRAEPPGPADLVGGLESPVDLAGPHRWARLAAPLPASRSQ